MPTLPSREPTTALVRASGAAKRAQAVDRTLALCDDGFVIDTVPFRIRSRDRAETAIHRAALGDQPGVPIAHMQTALAPFRSAPATENHP